MAEKLYLLENKNVLQIFCRFNHSILWRNAVWPIRYGDKVTHLSRLNSVRHGRFSGRVYSEKLTEGLDPKKFRCHFSVVAPISSSPLNTASETLNLRPTHIRLQSDYCLIWIEFSGELTALPKPSSWISVYKKIEVKGVERRGRERRRREGGERKGWKGRGASQNFNMWTLRFLPRDAL